MLTKPQAQRMALVTLKHANKYIQRMQNSGEFGDAEGTLFLKLAAHMVEGAADIISAIGDPEKQIELNHKWKARRTHVRQ